MTLTEAIVVLSAWHYEGGVPWTKTEQEALKVVLKALERVSDAIRASEEDMTTGSDLYDTPVVALDVLPR